MQDLQGSGRGSKKVHWEKDFKKMFVQLLEEGGCDKDFEHGGNQHHVPGGVGGWQSGEPQDH